MRGQERRMEKKGQPKSEQKRDERGRGAGYRELRRTSKEGVGDGGEEREDSGGEAIKARQLRSKDSDTGSLQKVLTTCRLARYCVGALLRRRDLHIGQVHFCEYSAYRGQGKCILACVHACEYACMSACLLAYMHACMPASL